MMQSQASQPVVVQLHLDADEEPAATPNVGLGIPVPHEEGDTVRLVYVDGQIVMCPCDASPCECFTELYDGEVLELHNVPETLHTDRGLTEYCQAVHAGGDSSPILRPTHHGIAGEVALSYGELLDYAIKQHEECPQGPLMEFMVIKKIDPNVGEGC